ncbi:MULTISPECIES: IS701 family transposase [unclassified Streptomyces]|uniref:IS701 family transposase n=1 Tax=unclassified Streptomyces TaxID=2593676 RepID=UPI00381EBF86
MDAHEVMRVRAKLALFVADVFASVPRKDQRAKGDCYLRGLMLDGRRKSIQAMAARLPDGNEQNLQQFVNQSTWDPMPVRRRIAERMTAVISPDAWVVDDVSFPKDGRRSVGVAPQYCGALGKRANCQVAVSVHAVTASASSPLQWRLFLPKEWADDAERRTACRVPSGVGHREKWRLALDILDELAGWGLPPRVMLADAAYGTNAAFRGELTELGLGYVLSVRSGVTAHLFDAVPEAPDRKGTNGCWPQPRYRQAPLAVSVHAASLGYHGFTDITWREGTRGQMRSRFAALRVRPASNSVVRPLRSRASAEQGWWDGVLPDLWLLAEWPADAKEPTEYWFSNLPADTKLEDLVGWAKLRWRVEHDYRELKHGLGLDHFEGRSWPGWHHHVTLATAAQAFLTEQRLSPKAPTPVSPSTTSSTSSRTY